MRILILAILVVWAPQSFAREIVKAPSFKVNSAAKLTALASMPPFNAETSAQGPTGAALLRVRIEPSLKAGSWNFDAAYDNQLSVVSGTGLSLTSALPTNNAIPFRLWQLSHQAQSGDWTDVGQLDRAFVSFHTSLLDITAGRQAIGWGRGNFFSAVDIFAPFTPLQVDQEWRAGVDALNVDVRVSDTASIQAVVTGADSFENVALGGRARGYFGSFDVEVEVAKRARDIMYATAGSVPISDAEVHWEYALFHTPSEGALTSKGVIGASNNFQLGSGIRVALEYHYSGFGAGTAAQLGPLLANPAFVARLLQGATQIIGAHVIGASASYTFNTQLNGTLTILQSAMDNSGVLSPSLVWDFADLGSLLATAFFAWGDRPQNGVLQSQFGAIVPSFIVQLRVYD